MTRFDLDYRPEEQHPRLPRWAQWSLAIAGALLVADVGRHVLRERAAITALEPMAALTQSAELKSKAALPAQPTQPVLGQRIGLGAATSPRATSETIARAESIARRLSVPWDTLFESLEATTTRGLRLTAILPDATRSGITISGEAKDYLAVINYVNALSEPQRLRHVHIVRHELRAQDPRFTTTFEIQARWADVREAPREQSPSGTTGTTGVSR